MNLLGGFIGLAVRRLLHTLALPPDDLLGAPADSRKQLYHLWGRLQQRKWKILKKQARKLKKYFRFPATANYDRVKLDRALLVEANRWSILSEDSTDYFERVKEQWAGRHRVEIVRRPGSTEMWKLYNRYALSWDIRQQRHSRYFWEIVRFLLHFKAWLRCRELRAAVLVAECGAQLPAAMPEPQFRHLAVLARKVGGSKKLDNLHCYALTPDAADRLVESAGQMLLPALNQFMIFMSEELDVDVVYQPLVPNELDDRVIAVMLEQWRQTQGKELGSQEKFWAD